MSDFVSMEIMDRVYNTIQKEYTYEKDDINNRNRIFNRAEQLLRNELVDLGYNYSIINRELKKFRKRGMWINGTLYRPN